MDFIEAKNILSAYSTNNPWFGVNYNMNIYKGCCHGCIYCDSRSDCYGVENFDKVRAKKNVLEILAKELKSKRKTGVVGTGAMSDPYNPFEKKYALTRGALELIHRYGFGAAIATKSDLVRRDIDLLKSIQEHSPVLIKITITTCDDDLCRIIEPNVALASKRFECIKELSDNGIFTGILMMPVLPFIEDNEENIKGIIQFAHKSGAKFIYPAFGVTLRQNQREWYYNRLDEYFPGFKEKYIQQYGNAYQCPSPKAKKLWYLLKGECERLGMLYKMKDIIFAYKQWYQYSQLSLF